MINGNTNVVHNLRLNIYYRVRNEVSFKSNRCVKKNFLAFARSTNFFTDDTEMEKRVFMLLFLERKMEQ